MSIEVKSGFEFFFFWFLNIQEYINVLISRSILHCTCNTVVMNTKKQHSTTRRCAVDGRDMPCGPGGATVVPHADSLFERPF